jgi:hypothetical protein
MTTVVIVVPDTGPLISLARAERLDLLTLLRLPVYIVDQVFFEATRSEGKPDAAAIAEFVAGNAAQVHVAETATGINARLAREAGLASRRQSSLGEASVSEFLTDFDNRFDDVAPLLIFEDSDILKGRIVIPGNVHVVSTKTFVYGLALRRLIADPDAVWQSIKNAGRNPSETEHDRAGTTSRGKTEW